MSANMSANKEYQIQRQVSILVKIFHMKNRMT